MSRKTDKKPKPKKALSLSLHRVKENSKARVLAPEIFFSNDGEEGDYGNTKLVKKV